MAKRKDRIIPMRHHRESIEALKTLEPCTTPEHWRDFSDTLLDIAHEALGMAMVLEDSKRPSPERFDRLVKLVSSLPEKAAKEPEKKPYQIWSVRTDGRGALYHDMVYAMSFVEACRTCFEGDPAYDATTNAYLGSKLVDNEIDARNGG